jgi:hypothetical protein
MISFKAFEILISIITGSREREREAHQHFMGFYQELVRITPADVAKAFGSITAPTQHNGKIHNYGLELTVTDCLWWKTIIEEGGRFTGSVSRVQRDIWERLNLQVREGWMNDENRHQLVSIMQEADQERLTHIAS